MVANNSPHLSQETTKYYLEAWLSDISYFEQIITFVTSVMIHIIAHSGKNIEINILEK